MHSFATEIAKRFQSDLISALNMKDLISKFL